jgi:hypothetical protein
MEYTVVTRGVTLVRNNAISRTMASKMKILRDLRAFASAAMCLHSRCLAMNYSGSQASYHNISSLTIHNYSYISLSTYTNLVEDTS